MAQKKSLAKNRKRKAMFRNANPIFPIKSYIKPKLEITFAIDEAMRNLISSLKGADPKQFAMAYNNDGPIAVMFAPTDWDIAVTHPKPGEHPLDFTQRALGKWLNADGSEPIIKPKY